MRGALVVEGVGQGAPQTARARRRPGGSRHSQAPLGYGGYIYASTSMLVRRLQLRFRSRRRALFESTTGYVGWEGRPLVKTYYTMALPCSR